MFPSYMTITADDTSEIEEERRLAYVGITRAKEDLTLCAAKMRMIRGETQYNAVSRFVKEIPTELLDNKPPSAKRMDSDIESHVSKYNPMYNTMLRNKPVATLTPKRTAAENKPFIASGVGDFGKLGIVKGTGNATGSKPDYDAGDRVRHIKYGDGTVIDIEPGPRDYKVTVDFDDMGQKIMYAAFAKLKKL